MLSARRRAQSRRGPLPGSMGPPEPRRRRVPPESHAGVLPLPGPGRALALLGLLPWLLLCAPAPALQRADAKLITGLAPCPNGAPPARECLVSVLVDLRALRALRARARERERERAERNNSTAPPQDTQVALPREDPRPDPAQDQQEQELPQQAIDVDLRLEHEQQQRRQQQLEQAVRFQEDELQQLREQVQELRQQLARALQLYQLTSAAARPPPLPAPLQYQASVKSLPLQLRGGGGGAGSTGFFHPQSPPVVPRPAPDLRAGFTGYGPAHEGAARRFYRTLPPAASKVASPATASATATTSAPAVSAPIYGQRLRYVGLRELARGDTVVAT